MKSVFQPTEIAPTMNFAFRQDMDSPFLWRQPKYTFHQKQNPCALQGLFIGINNKIHNIDIFYKMLLLTRDKSTYYTQCKDYVMRKMHPLPK